MRAREQVRPAGGSEETVLQALTAPQEDHIPTKGKLSKNKALVTERGKSWRGRASHRRLDLLTFRRHRSVRVTVPHTRRRDSNNIACSRVVRLSQNAPGRFKQVASAKTPLIHLVWVTCGGSEIV